MSPVPCLERIQFIPRPRAEVFAFFGDAHNLSRITPGFLRFRILTPAPIEMRAGTRIDYRLHLWGLPLRWQTRIESFEAGQAFVDVQVRGPYRKWIHRHEFRDVIGGTEMRDRVDYELPWGLLGKIAHALVVRQSLHRIFDHRAAVIAELLAAPPAR